MELALRFPKPDQVVVRLTDEDGEITDSDTLLFVSPIPEPQQEDLHWYLEVYAAGYTTEVDDARAEDIAEHLPALGEALFQAVFGQDAVAKRLFDRFQDSEKKGRLLTVSSSHPAVLAQPWELLRDPNATFLFLERPRISVRRRLAGVGGGRKPFRVQSKARLRLLFVVSRPEGAGFIDPRSDPEAVMDALAEHARQVSLPATLAGNLRKDEAAKDNQGYLLFEEAEGKKAPISADLLHAVHGALDASEPWAVEFAEHVNKFLNAFGLARDRAALTEAAKLAQSDDNVRSLTGALQTGLADALKDQGDYAGARAAYEAALDIEEPLGDDRSVAVVNGQLGTLARTLGDLAEAERRYRAALTIFQQHLEEPEPEAVMWHQLGIVFQEAERWDDAEQAYREAANIKERIGLITGPNAAVSSWHQLAGVVASSGRPADAEAWYRKTLAAYRTAGDRAGLARTLGNLADLLQHQPPRLAEARTFAEEGLAIDRTVDPAAAEIWKTYSILANIAAKQGDETAARDFRRQAREAQSAFMGTEHQLRRFVPLMTAVVQAVQGDTEAREAVGKRLPRCRTAASRARSSSANNWSGSWPATAACRTWMPCARRPH